MGLVIPVAKSDGYRHLNTRGSRRARVLDGEVSPFRPSKGSGRLTRNRGARGGAPASTPKAQVVFLGPKGWTNLKHGKIGRPAYTESRCAVVAWLLRHSEPAGGLRLPPPPALMTPRTPLCEPSARWLTSPRRLDLMIGRRGPDLPTPNGGFWLAMAYAFTCGDLPLKSG